jgi:hypothetical protein
VRRDRFDRDLVEATPDLVQVDHQAGGYACMQETVTGVVLPLRDPAVPTRKPLVPLLNGLAAIGESQQVASPFDRRLEAFGYTFGEPIDVALVHTIVAEYLDVPPFDEGVEALVSGPLANPAHFANWSTWQPDGQARPFDEALVDQLIAATALSGEALRLFLLWENSD